MFADIHLLRFAFNGSGMADYPAGATFGPRTLGDFEFVWIVEGDVEWQVDGQLIPAPAGTVVLARPGQRDGFRWDPRHRTRHGFFHFNLDQGKAVLPPREHWPLSRNLPVDDILRPLFHHLGWLLAREGEDARELAQGIMRQALVAYLSGLLGTTGEGDQPLHPLVDRALAHVQELWADGDPVPVTLGDLARAAGVSKTHLTRVFQQALGVSPVEALRQVRLDRAAGLLARTNLAVQQVAEATGFPNAFHFSKVFHLAYGVSPRAFRQGVLRGETPAINRLVRTRALAGRLWHGPG